MSVRDRIAVLYEQVDGQGYGPLLILIVAIQGTVLISQSLAAMLLPAAQVGVIRTFESIFSVLVLIAGLGAPALALREMAARVEANARARALRDLAVLPLAGAVIVVVAAAVAAALRLGFVQSIAHVLPLVLALLIAVNLTRLLAAVAQGLLIVGHVYCWTAVGAVACAMLQTGFALGGTLEHWILGRILGEGVLLGAIVIASRSRLPHATEGAPWHGGRFVELMRAAVTINGGLVIRMAADAAPIVLLSLAAARAVQVDAVQGRALQEQVGYFGIASLALTLAMLPISVVSQQALPVLTKAVGFADVALINRRFARRMLLVSLGIAAIVAGVALLIHAIQITNVVRGMLPAAVLMIAVPLKAMAVVCGNLLTARGRFHPPIVVNSVELAVIIAAFLLLPFPPDAILAASVVIVASIVSVSGFVIASRDSA